MGFWHYFVGEGYCLYSACKDKQIKVCRMDSTEKFFEDLKRGKRRKWETIKNSGYINKKPFCKSPGRMTWKKFSKCVNKDRGRICPFFGYTLADRKEFIAAVKAIEQ